MVVAGKMRKNRVDREGMDVLRQEPTAVQPKKIGKIMVGQNRSQRTGRSQGCTHRLLMGSIIHLKYKCHEIDILKILTNIKMWCSRLVYINIQLHYLYTITSLEIFIIILCYVYTIIIYCPMSDIDSKIRYWFILSYCSICSYIYCCPILYDCFPDKRYKIRRVFSLKQVKIFL